jgi:hypothetical protein
MGVSIGVYTWFFETKIRVGITLLKTTGLSLGFALPLIVFSAFVMQGLWVLFRFPIYLPYYNYYLILIGFFFMILFVYLAAIVVFSSPEPAYRANEIIRSPMILILFSGKCYYDTLGSADPTHATSNFRSWRIPSPADTLWVARVNRTLAGHRQTSPRTEGPFQGTQLTCHPGH